MGDRRAMAVRSALIKAGAGRKQVLIQSRGAARPLIELAGEEVAQYRRRVTLDYLDAQCRDHAAAAAGRFCRLVALGVRLRRQGAAAGRPARRLRPAEAARKAQSSSDASRPGNSTSVKPNCVKSRIRIGYSLPIRWSHSCCTTRA